MPARAHDVGDAGAHHPGAEHADLGALYAGTPAGRDSPELMACRSKKNAWIMFLLIGPVTRSTK